jgi:hypothetical protein
MFQIDDIREKNVEKFYEIYLKEGKIKLIESIAEGLNKRTYFTIDKEGNIKRNEMNPSLPMIVSINNENYRDIIKTIIEDLVDLTQREKIKKIERLSKFSIDTLIENFNKLMANGDKIFGLKYGKELFLRDKTLFFKMLFDYVLLEDISTKKSIMAWSLYELLKENQFSDEVFYVGMSYIIQRRSEFGDHERILNGNFVATPKEEVIPYAVNDTLLEIVCYANMLGEFSYKKEEYYTEKLKEAFYPL